MQETDKPTVELTEEQIADFRQMEKDKADFNDPLI